MHRSEPKDPRPDSHTLLDRVLRLRLKPHRDASGLHFVAGLRPVLQPLAAARPVETILYSERLCWNPSAQKRVRRARSDGVRVARVTPEQFRRISLTPRASGLGAILRQHWTPLERIDPLRG